MSHFRIADALLDRIDGLDPEMFAIGSIGPDSGLPDEKWENFDPPKEISHFEFTEDGVTNCADLDFYRRYLAGFDKKKTSQYSFLLGYYLHLITDDLWRIHIWRPHRAAHPDWFERDPRDFNTETKRDWYGQDFIYVRDHPDSLFHRVFAGVDADSAAASAAPLLDFMSAAAFAHQIDYIRTFYQRTDERVQVTYTREYRFLTKDQMDRFVDESAATLMRVYAEVVAPAADTGDHRSVVTLLNL